MKKRSIIGYVVVEACDSYEQTLALKQADSLPPGGILVWRSNGDRVHLFADRKEARAAIDRTDHYRLAWARMDVPERKYCKVVPVEQEPKP